MTNLGIMNPCTQMSSSRTLSESNFIICQRLYILHHHIRHRFLLLILINAITDCCYNGCHNGNFQYILFHNLLKFRKLKLQLTSNKLTS